MVYHKTQKNIKGFSLVEVIIVSGIITLFFTQLFGGIYYTLALIADSKARLTALSVANNEMEYIYSLSYDAIGTVAGIPAGLIPQTSTSTLNNIEFETKVLINYVDDDADGVGASDSNGITTDYKEVKVTVSWVRKGVTRQIFLVSNIVPRSIETNVGGGTIRVNVFDASVLPLPGASVRLVNNTIVPNIDVTRTSDANGIALFGGAPAGPDYQIFVSAPGYSSDQTYEAIPPLVNPASQPIAVIEADISTMNFFIDRVSTLDILTLGSQISRMVDYPFNDTSNIATSTDVTVSSGALVLTDTAGVYNATGTATLAAVAPALIQKWSNVNLIATTTVDTTIRMQFYTGTSSYTLIPDGDLPGNSSGFSLFPVDISALSTVSYPSFSIGLTLASASSTITPAVDSVAVQYIESQTPLDSVPLNLLGAKSIGTDASSSPIFKTNLNITSDGVGRALLNNLEYDSYTVTATGYDIAEACPANPITIEPNTSNSLSMVLSTNTTNSLRVIVQTLGGIPIAGASVTLDRPGYTSRGTTSACGQKYFGSLTNADDYLLTVAAAGYGTQAISSTTVSGDQVQIVSF